MANKQTKAEKNAKGLLIEQKRWVTLKGEVIEQS